jgi:hypothetical protein
MALSCPQSDYKKLSTGSSLESKGVGTAALDHGRLFHLQGVVDLLRQLPNELLTVGAAEFADLTVATAVIVSTLLRYTKFGFAPVNTLSSSHAPPAKGAFR